MPGHVGRGRAAAALLLAVVLAAAARAEPARFVDNGNGTVTDRQTGLMWEQKTGVVGGRADAPDPHNVNNRYTWRTGGLWNAEGTAFTDFLAKVNAARFGGHDDWRLPTTAELQSIIAMDAPGCGAGRPCIDPVFGPTQVDFYWSSSSFAGNPFYAAFVCFSNGSSATYGHMPIDFYVRAVRGGV